MPFKKVPVFCDNYNAYGCDCDGSTREVYDFEPVLIAKVNLSKLKLGFGLTDGVNTIYVKNGKFTGSKVNVLAFLKMYLDVVK